MPTNKTAIRNEALYSPCGVGSRRAAPCLTGRASFVFLLFFLWTFALVWLLPGGAWAAANDASFTLKKIKTGVKSISAPRLSGDGKKIFFQSGDSVYQMNSDGSGSPLKAADGSFNDISHDASKALLTKLTYEYDAALNSIPRRMLYILDTAAGSITGATPCVSSGVDTVSYYDKQCISPLGAALSGDGNHVFFTSDNAWDCVYTTGWSCSKGSGVERLWRVPADDPSNPGKVELVFDPEAEWSERTYNGNFSSLLADHSGGVAFAYSAYKANADGTSGPAVGGIYISRNGNVQKVYDYDGTVSPDTSLKLFSPDGKWLVWERANTVYLFNTAKKNEAKVVSRVFDANQDSAQVYGISEDGQWLLFYHFFNKKKNITPKYSMVSRDKTRIIPLITYEDEFGSGRYIEFAHGAGNPVSYDGGVALFYDPNGSGGDIYVARKKENQCAALGAAKKRRYVASLPANLPKETRAIMEDACRTDYEKKVDIATLVEGWLKESIIDAGDLTNYIIPSLEAAKELERGYEILDEDLAGGGIENTPFFRTLAAELMDSKLASDFIGRLRKYCKKGDDKCGKSVLKKVLFLCGESILSPRSPEDFLEQTLKPIDQAVDRGTSPLTANTEMAQKIRNDVFSGDKFAFGIITHIVEGLIDMIPVGQVLSIIKKGFQLFLNAVDAYKDMTPKDRQLRSYSYTSAIDGKDYTAVAAISRVPRLARVHIQVVRGQGSGKNFDPDEKVSYFGDLPISLNFGSSTVQDLVKFDYVSIHTMDGIMAKAQTYFQSLEKKGYTAARKIEWEDYDSTDLNALTPVTAGKGK
ncbi:MAG: PD40 domain-containing protein [Nitrospinae bacterium]|nr:PD40 domain-containing protein [Nitrospinota bacterium]